MTVTLALLLAAPALTALAVTGVAAFGWPRGARGAPLGGPVSLLVPARNEERNIEASLDAARAQPVEEILVYDDMSGDRTAAIVDRVSRDDPRVRRIEGSPLPDAWVGKVHACARLAEEATGTWLVYQDADVRLEPGGLERLGWLARHLDADVVTAVPRQVLGSPLEGLLVPLLHLIYTSWLPAPLIWLTSDPRVLMANGQVLAVRRDALLAAGGWASVRREVVEDMAICRRFKEAGLRVVFADGHAVARCRMYRSGREVWAGFAKNLFEGLGDSAGGLAAAILLHLWAFVLPALALALAGLGVGGEELWLGGLLGVTANVLQRGWLTVRHAQPGWSALLQPLAVLVLAVLAIDSWRRSAQGRIEWRGRTYKRRASRA
jgi:chlorobactene glucosyltransferase